MDVHDKCDCLEPASPLAPAPRSPPNWVFGIKWLTWLNSTLRVEAPTKFKDILLSATMVRSTIIVRASDALPLAASVDDEQVRLFAFHWYHFSPFILAQTEQALQEHKQQSKLIFRRITPNSEPRCSIESGPYTLQCVMLFYLYTSGCNSPSHPPLIRQLPHSR